MIKAVVFDLDDTLISERQYIESGFRVVAKYISESSNIDVQVIYETMMSLFEKSSKQVFNRLLDYFKLSYTDENIRELINIYRNHKPEISLYEDAKDILEYLYNKDIKLGIITDGYKNAQRNKLESLNIYKYFDYIVVTDELGREYWKPHKKSYNLVKDYLNLKYEEMMYVGDNEAKDFITANELGISTIMIDRGVGVYSNTQEEEKYKAKIQISNLNELKQILEKNKMGECSNG